MSRLIGFNFLMWWNYMLGMKMVLLGLSLVMSFVLSVCVKCGKCLKLGVEKLMRLMGWLVGVGFSGFM